VKKFIRLGLILNLFIFFVGCGSEAPGAYDTAFKSTEIKNKTFQVVQGTQSLLIIFYSNEFEIRNANGFTIELGEFSIDKNGVLTLGEYTYSRISIDSTTQWSVTQAYDSDGDGEDEYSDTTWYLDAQEEDVVVSDDPLALSSELLDGMSVYMLEGTQIIELDFQEDRYYEKIYNSDDTLESSMLYTYTIESDGSLSNGTYSYKRIEEVSDTEWTMLYTIDGESIEVTWYLEKPE